MPRDAAGAAGRASINDRSPSGRIQGSEGKKVRLTQFARKVGLALRPVLASSHAPLFLAGVDPLLSIFRSLSSAVDLAPDTISGSPDRMSDAELAGEVRPLYSRQIDALKSRFAARAAEQRATTDLAEAGRAATQGAIDTMLVDIDAIVPGTYDEDSGRIVLAEQSSKHTYGVIDAIAIRALATGARVLGVRAADIPGGDHLAAVLRYAI
jgi:hypothetical protein